MGKRSQSQERWKKRRSPQPANPGQTIQRMRPAGSKVLSLMLAAEMLGRVQKGK